MSASYSSRCQLYPVDVFVGRDMVKLGFFGVISCGFLRLLTSSELETPRHKSEERQ